jgi:hypothetical protein
MQNIINLQVQEYIKKYCKKIEEKYNIENVYEIYLDFSNETPLAPFCSHILVSGPRAGEECGIKATKGDKCTRHYKMQTESKEKKMPVKKIPTDILVLRKDKQGNIYHPATNLAFDQDKNVIGKYYNGNIDRNIDFDSLQLQTIQKYTLQILN